ncbi:DsrE family protein [Haloprofundus salinisoli]|uniref:DsrE family protein n=1 Tax=Haloprofundus salinisoli TaxID=2876193 RepID=UPI001CCD27A7|nr:DsrE family protein [Haloprofundus salinisoli]
MRTVFHLSSGDENDHAHALANVENLLDDESVDTDHVALVVNGDAIYLLTESSAAPDRIATLADCGVDFCACGNAMETRDISTEDLLAGVERVSSGVGELTRRQADGYAYLKVP